MNKWYIKADGYLSLFIAIIGLIVISIYDFISSKVIYVQRKRTRKAKNRSI